MNDPLFINSIHKGMAVLNAFSDGERRLSLNQLVNKTGFNKSSIQRIVYTFERIGFLEKEDDSKMYKLTPKTLTLSYNYLRTNPLIEKATPHLVNQSKLTNHTFNLSILDDTDIVYIIRIPNHQQALKATLLGRRLPAISTSGGRAILSRMEEDDVIDIIKRTNIAQRTRYTIIDSNKIMEEILKAKDCGYAITQQESLIGEIVVASAVLDAKERPVGAVHIPNNISKWSYNKVLNEVAPLAVATARAISVD